MLDILAIKADVYQLERQGKRLTVYRYLREVWQKEPPSEGLTVLALQQMVDYVEYVDDLTVLGEPWEAENEYDLYQDFLLESGLSRGDYPNYIFFECVNYPLSICSDGRQ